MLTGSLACIFMDAMTAPCITFVFLSVNIYLSARNLSYHRHKQNYVLQMEREQISFSFPDVLELLVVEAMQCEHIWKAE